MQKVHKFIDSSYLSLQDRVPSLGVKALATFGLLLSLKYSFKLLSSFYRSFLAGGYDLAKRYGRGSWAVITGATGGAGSAFADELAKLGFNIVLMGRSESALQEKAEDMKKKFGPSIQTKIIQADLAFSAQEGFLDKIYQELKDLDVSILVNNAGTGVIGPVHENPDSSVLETIAINSIAPMLLTRRLLPKLMQRSGKAAVINVTSIVAVRPFLWMGIYSASKVFLDMFSRELEVQYGEKVDFLSCRFGTVSTKMVGHMKKVYSITPEQAVKGTLSKLGVVPYTFGHWNHQICGGLLLLPVIGDKVVRKIVTDATEHMTKLAQTQNNSV